MRTEIACEQAIGGEAGDEAIAIGYEKAKASREDAVEAAVLRLQRLVGAEREAAWAAWLRGMGRFVEARIAWYLGDDVDADELRQVAAAALWRAAIEWRPEGGRRFLSFARWGLRHALDTHVHHDRQVRSGRRLEGFSLDDEGEAAEELADGAESPEEALLRAEQRRRVRAALARLPEDQRRVLVDVSEGAMVKTVGRRAWEAAQAALRRELRRLGVEVAA
jgi:RNA polymerase sigma factor (sigma-70 family)